MNTTTRQSMGMEEVYRRGDSILLLALLVCALGFFLARGFLAGRLMLAQRSAQAAREIKDLINARVERVQDGNEQAQRLMEAVSVLHQSRHPLQLSRS